MTDAEKQVINDAIKLLKQVCINHFDCEQCPLLNKICKGIERKPKWLYTWKLLN